MPPRSIKFTLDGSSASAEVYAAFCDKPSVVIMQAAATRAASAVPSDALDAAKVEEMLGVKADWKLAVLKGDATGVLDRKLLEEVWKKSTGDVTVALRSPTPAESIVLNDSATLYGPAASWSRVKDAVGFPVAQAALVATGAGLFGFLALQSDIERLWAMKIAIIAAAAATGVSVFYGSWVKPIEVKPARLDLLRASQTSMYAHAVQRARIGIGLLLVAVVFAIVATWPSGGSAQSATIGEPTVTTIPGGGKRVTLTITWSGLGESVVKVRSMIGGSLATVAAKDKSVEQPLQTDVATGVSSLRVETRAVDDQGNQVGTGYTKEVKLSAP